MLTDAIMFALNVALVVIVFSILLYYLANSKKLDELSRRILLVGFFLSVHELTFFLLNPFVYELTKTIFYMTLFYVLIYLITVNKETNKRLMEAEELGNELKRRVERRVKENIGTL